MFNLKISNKKIYGSDIVEEAWSTLRLWLKRGEAWHFDRSYSANWTKAGV